MNYVEKALDGVHYMFNLNAATLSGAIDILVIEQEDGTLKSTPFHVRFGKLQLLSSSEKIVSLRVNEEETDLKMKLGSAGEAFFVAESEVDGSSSPMSTSQVMPSTPSQSPPRSPSPIRNGNGNATYLKEETLTSKLEDELQKEATMEEGLTKASSSSSGEHVKLAEWGWGSLPKVTDKKMDRSLESSSESTQLAEEPKLTTQPVEEKDSSKSSAWSSMFRIFKGPDPQLEYLIKSESETEEEYDEEVAEISSKMKGMTVSKDIGVAMGAVGGTKVNVECTSPRLIDNSSTEFGSDCQQFSFSDEELVEPQRSGISPPLISSQELGELKIEISKCGNVIGANLNEHVVKEIKIKKKTELD